MTPKRVARLSSAVIIWLISAVLIRLSIGVTNCCLGTLYMSEHGTVSPPLWWILPPILVLAAFSMSLLAVHVAIDDDPL
jgi:hypothetical protein